MAFLAPLANMALPGLVGLGVSQIPNASRVIGKHTRGGVGGAIGRGIGSLIGGAQELFGRKGETRRGGDIGDDIGRGLLGFRNGGRVKRTRRALVHKGEFVLPRGVKPTKKQRKKVMKKKMRARRK